MIDQLIHLIKARQAELQSATASGVPQSWDTYQRMVGNHQGLQDALDMIDHMLEEEEGRN